MAKAMATPRTWWLRIRLWFLLTVLFGITYGLVSVVSYILGIGNLIFYGVVAIGFILLQYMIGPSIVNWTMRVKYVDEKEEPELHKMIEELAKEAGLPKPRIGISQTLIPNAFAFGRWKSDGRICVTQGILKLLDKKELRAVLGHEMSHLKHRDVVVITLLSVIPLICWFLARGTLFSGSDRKGAAATIGIFAFVLYFITNLLVLYASRIREYYADAGSVSLGNEPHSLASALYKLVYGAAKTPPQMLKQVEGMKAFFANDVSRAHDEIIALNELDVDKSGTLDANEIALLKKKHIRLSLLDKLMELMSTHPNMLKRIQALAEMK
ncbi:MAG: zinc metalloprotease HtpX [Candidatus Nanoarchaeia archaeon]